MDIPFAITPSARGLPIDPDHCRRQAAECFIQAKQAPDAAVAARWLDLASRWIGLAAIDFLWQATEPEIKIAQAGGSC